MADKDLQLVQAVLAGESGAWERFVRDTADSVFGFSALVFGAEQGEAEALRLFERIQADDFAVMRPYDGRSELTTYVTLKLIDLIPDRIIVLFDHDAGRGWQVFEKFYGDEMKRLIRKRFFPRNEEGTFEDGSSLEDKYQDLCEKLIADNFKKLRGFKGQGSFTGFVRTTLRNLIEDLHRAMAGRKRLPKAIQALSELHQTIYKELAWNNNSREDVLRQLSPAGQGNPGSPEVKDAIQQVEKIIAESRQSGGAQSGTLVSIDAEGEGGGTLQETLPAVDANPAEQLEIAESEAARQEASEALAEAIAALPPQGQLYLQLRYLKDPPLAPKDIAPRLNLSIKALYKAREKWEKALKQELQKNLGKFSALSV
jgi:RNA polymerase primary sigma factor